MNGNNDISNVIDKANIEFENTWSTVLELSKILGIESDASIASHRIVSYNPQNVAISKMNISLGANSFCLFVSQKISEVSNRPEDAKLWAILAKCYMVLGDFPNSYTSVAHILRIDPAFKDSSFWYVAGVVYQHFMYYSDALKFFKLSQSLDPNSPFISDLLFRLSMLYRSLGNYDDAISHFKRVLMNIPSDLTEDDIRFQIAYTYQLNSMNELASQEYNDLYRRHQMSLHVIQQYSWYLSLHSDARSLSLAENLANNAPKQFSNDPVLKFVLARISLKQQDTSIAYQRYRESLGTWSDSPLFWCGLGVLYFKNEQYQDAIVAFQRALFLRSDITEAWLNFGLIFQKQNDIQSSLKIYQTALNNCSGSTQIQDRINLINTARSSQKPVPNFEIVEINGNKLFTQIAEKVANQYCSDKAVLSAKMFNVNKDEESVIIDSLPFLTCHHRSIF